MLTPQQFQDHILPYLYDLLEPAQRREFEATLEASAEARAGLESAKAKQKLLAHAVKQDFPEVTFKPPTGRNPQGMPATMPMSHAKPRRRWGRLVLAASLFLAVATGAIVFGIAGWNARQDELAEALDKYQKADVAARNLREQVATDARLAQADVVQLRAQVNKLDKDWKKEIELQKQTLRKQNLQVNITANRTAQAGANNTVVVAVENKKQEESQLNARVIDESNNVYFNKALDIKNGQNNFNIDLPRDLPLVPGNQLAFEVVSESTKDAPLAVRERLTLAPRICHAPVHGSPHVSSRRGYPLSLAHARTL
jgi:hypothetical protein